MIVDPHCYANAKEETRMTRQQTRRRFIGSAGILAAVAADAAKEARDKTFGGLYPTSSSGQGGKITDMNEIEAGNDAWDKEIGPDLEASLAGLNT